VIPRPEGEEWRRALMERLKGIRSDDPLLVGIRRIISTTLWDTIDASCQPDMRPEARTFNDGRMSACIDLEAQIDEAWKLANEPPKT